ncbi:glutamine amidotransferase [Nocardia sp. CDC153]|uniref:glutamine amidotransferase n=1 Tax=Nocardia sp. CDC153 TaxID=3112167 RepID=UPI002DB5AB37|nr:glutamine amidotransferase [Nocardia sp. CDC153]MEC3956438.1 glutamine amidotransferase [Nocardia sp. CDC153]
MPKPCLLLQLRPEQAASDQEYQAILDAGGLAAADVVRVEMNRGMPDVDLDDYWGVIVGGGPSNISYPEAKKYDYQKAFEPKLKKVLIEVVRRDFPYLGACYGLSMLADALGGVVSTERYAETAGATTIELTENAAKDPLLHGLPEAFRAFVGHKESCQDVPPGSVLLARSAACPVQAVRVGENVYATQFHPELDGHGLALRIEIYRHEGYFDPSEAEYLTELGHREKITVPQEILRRFVTRYQGKD